MGFVIDDGTGSNGSAKVSNNRLHATAVIKTEDHDVNEREGKVWSLPFEGLNPTGADDYVFYLKNTGENNIEISDFRLSADTAASQVKIHAVSGTAASGSTLTPVSRTIGSAALPTATIETGVNITGLTDDGIIFIMQLAVVNTQYHIRTSSKIIVPKGGAVAISVETATANLTGVVSIFEEV